MVITALDAVHARAGGRRRAVWLPDRRVLSGRQPPPAFAFNEHVEGHLGEAARRERLPAEMRPTTPGAGARTDTISNREAGTTGAAGAVAWPINRRWIVRAVGCLGCLLDQSFDQSSDGHVRLPGAAYEAAASEPSFFLTDGRMFAVGRDDVTTERHRARRQGWC